VAVRDLRQVRSLRARVRSVHSFVGGLALATLLLVAFGQSQSAGAALPPGFQESVAFSGLDHPTALRFSPDGRIFVAEKNGRIKVFDNLADTTPTLFADLSTNVYNFWDRGLLGLALDPAFPSQPYVYVLYTYDHELGSTAPAPRWGTPGVLSDPCPTPPGPTADGCVVSGRLSRLEASGNVMVGSEQVLIEDWCQQYPSHSTGSLAFGSDGALYASGGDGASFNFADWGQDGNPLNPCGDPPGTVGSVLSPPTAEGGALRSQDLRTSGDPVSLDGAIVRDVSGPSMPRDVQHHPAGDDALAPVLDRAEGRSVEGDLLLGIAAVPHAALVPGVAEGIDVGGGHPVIEDAVVVRGEAALPTRHRAHPVLGREGVVHARLLGELAAQRDATAGPDQPRGPRTLLGRDQVDGAALVVLPPAPPVPPLVEPGADFGVGR